MGEPNNSLNVYMSKPERIRSVMEYFLQEKIADAWKCSDEDVFFTARSLQGKLSFRQRDIFKRIELEWGHFFLGIENQMTVNLTFPFRLMEMDNLAYGREIERIQQDNIAQRVAYRAEDDYKYRFRKNDRLKPVINLVLYWGKKPWLEPLSLKAMLDTAALPSSMHMLLQDYRLNLICMRHIPQKALNEMDSDLKYVLGIMKCSNSKKQYLKYIRDNKEFFSRVPKSAVDVLSVCMKIENIQKYLQYTEPQGEKEAETDMCKALDDIIKDATRDGKKKGERIGERRGMRLGEEEATLLNIKKLMKNLKLSAEQAMEILEIPKSSRARYQKRI